MKPWDSLFVRFISVCSYDGSSPTLFCLQVWQLEAHWIFPIYAQSGEQKQNRRQVQGRILFQCLWEESLLMVTGNALASPVDTTSVLPLCYIPNKPRKSSHPSIRYSFLSPHTLCLSGMCPFPFSYATSLMLNILWVI